MEENKYSYTDLRLDSCALFVFYGTRYIKNKLVSEPNTPNWDLSFMASGHWVLLETAVPSF